MKIVLFLIISFGFTAGVSGQQRVEGFPAETARQVPFTGYNLNSQTKPKWTTAFFLDSVRVLAPHMLRYPGGTESQYWDWKSGTTWPVSKWAPEGTFQNYRYLAAQPGEPTHTLSEFKFAADALSATPVFVLNVTTDSLESQLRFLLEAYRTGFEIDFIELGNELYFDDADFVTRFPHGGHYAREMNRWIDSIRHHFPQAQIAAAGSSNTPLSPSGQPTSHRMQQWNDSLYALLRSGVDITFHRYYRHGQSATAPVLPENVLAFAKKGWEEEKAATIETLPAGRLAWWTEYNLTDDLNGDHLVATSWIHGMFTGFLHHLKLAGTENRMILCHQISGSEPFGALNSYFRNGDTLQNNITAVGTVLSTFHAAEKGASTVNPVSFNPNPMVSAGPQTWPSLAGWQFDKPGYSEVVVMNLSSNEFELNMPVHAGKKGTLSQFYSSNPVALNAHNNAIRKMTGDFSNVMTLRPYSVSRVVIEKQSVRTEEQSPENKANVRVFSNGREISIASDAGITDLRVFDILGRSVFQKSVPMNAGGYAFSFPSHVSQGIYLIRTTDTKNRHIFTRVFIH